MRYLGAVSRYLDVSRYFDVSRSVQAYFAAGSDLTDAQSFASSDGAEVVNLATAATVTLQCPGVPQSLSAAIISPQSGASAGADFQVTFDFDPVGSTLAQGACLPGAASFQDGYGVPAKTVTITFPPGSGTVTGGSILFTLTCR